MPDELDTDAIRARAEAVSDSAQWVIERDDHPNESNWLLTGLDPDGTAEPLGVLSFGDVAQFVIHAFTDIPTLLARLTEVEGERDAAQRMVRLCERHSLRDEADMLRFVARFELAEAERNEARTVRNTYGGTGPVRDDHTTIFGPVVLALLDAAGAYLKAQETAGSSTETDDQPSDDVVGTGGVEGQGGARGAGCLYVLRSVDCELSDKHCLELSGHSGAHMFGSDDGPIAETEWIRRTSPADPPWLEEAVTEAIGAWHETSESMLLDDVVGTGGVEGQGEAEGARVWAGSDLPPLNVERVQDANGGHWVRADGTWWQRAVDAANGSASAVNWAFLTHVYGPLTEVPTANLGVVSRELADPPADPPWLEEAIEAAVQHLKGHETSHEQGALHGYGWDDMGHATLTPRQGECDRCQQIATAAIRAALPLIAQGVLEDAADDCEREWADAHGDVIAQRLRRQVTG